MNKSALRAALLEEFWTKPIPVKATGKNKDREVCAMIIAKRITAILIRGISEMQKKPLPLGFSDPSFGDGKKRKSEFYIAWTIRLLEDPQFRKKMQRNIMAGFRNTSDLWNSDLVTTKISRKWKGYKPVDLTQEELYPILVAFLQLQTNFVDLTYPKRIPTRTHGWLMLGLGLDAPAKFLTNPVHEPSEGYLLAYMAALGYPIDNPRPPKRKWSWWLAAGIIAVIAVQFLILGAEKRNVSLDDQIINLKWINYEPIDYCPFSDRFPDTSAIRTELKFLREQHSGIITFGCAGTLVEIPRIAKELGFEAVIMGIENPDSIELIESAVSARKYVDGYCIGHNWGIDSLPPIDWSMQKQQLLEKIKLLKYLAGKPVSITYYYDAYDPEFKGMVDWIFPDIGGTWREAISDSSRQMDYLLQEFNRYVEQAKEDVANWGKPVLLKMVSCPSGGTKPFTEAFQARFFNAIENRYSGRTSISFPKTSVGISVFGAWDIPWKHPGGPGPVVWQIQERFIGLYSNDFRLKQAAEYLP